MIVQKSITKYPVPPVPPAGPVQDEQDCCETKNPGNHLRDKNEFTHLFILHTRSLGEKPALYRVPHVLHEKKGVR